jgi:hypothetical protein
MGDREVRLGFEGKENLVIAIRPREEPANGAVDWFSLWVVQAPKDETIAVEALRAAWSLLSRQGRIIHPLGEDAILPASRSIGARLRLLRRSAPFGALVWVDVRIGEGGRRAELLLEDTASGEQAIVWLGEQNGRPTGGYTLAGGQPSMAIREGIGALIGALREAEPRAAARQ